MRGLYTLALCLLVGTAHAAERLPTVVTRALETSNRAVALASLEAEVGTNTDPKSLPWVLLYAGELRRLEGDLPSARQHFESVAGDWPASGARGPAVLGLAVVDAGGTAGGNVLATLGLIPDTNVPATLNADRYLLLADARASAGAPADEVAGLARKARTYAAEDREVARRVNKATESWLLAANTTPAEATAAAIPSAAIPSDLAAIEAIRADLAAHRFDEVLRKSAAFTSAFPESPFAREAGYAARRATAKVAPDPKKVLVLLPLTGVWSVPAANLRAAIEQANQSAGASAMLVFQDTAGKPEQCVKLLEAGVIDGGATYVIGPLRREEAVLCAPAAQALHVPMLTLSSSPELAAIGDAIFRPFPSTEEQISALLDEVFERRGKTTYAILHPKTSYGENAATAFQAEVLRRGGQVLRIVGYDPNATDFRSTAKALGEKDYKARAAEFAQLKAQASARGEDPAKVVLPPDAGFSAIFIPDNYQHVALIASALAFEEFPVGSFRPHYNDEPITLIGLNAWNNDDLARRGGKYVVGSIFVDAFDPRANDPETRRFVERWKEEHDGNAPSVVEAVGYDTMRLVQKAIRTGGDPLRALAGATIELGVAGTVGFDAERRARRTWRVLSVNSGGIVSLGADAPPTEEGASPP